MTQAELLEQMPDALKPCLAPTLGLWWLYRAVMWLKRRERTLTGWQRGGAWLFVAAAYVLDVLYNATVAWRIFREPPREWTLTARLQRYKQVGSGWPNVTPLQRRNWQLAVWICDNMLNPYDPDGEHC